MQVQLLPDPFPVDAFSSMKQSQIRFFDMQAGFNSKDKDMEILSSIVEWCLCSAVTMIAIVAASALIAEVDEMRGRR